MNHAPNAAASLDGKRVVLTGGSTGIGRAILYALAKAGADPLTCGRNREPLDEALRLAGLGTDAGVVADVSDPADVERLFAEADRRLGGIDILICNAALPARSIDEMADADWRRAVGTNLVGYMACTKAALERMKPRGEGHILMISSISADIPMGGESVYAATKAGVDGFALALRQELRELGISVSTVSPGSVRTDLPECSKEQLDDLVSREEMLTAEDVADAALWLLTRPRRCNIFDVRIEPRLQAIPAVA